MERRAVHAPLTRLPYPHTPGGPTRVPPRPATLNSFQLAALGAAVERGESGYTGDQLAEMGDETREETERRARLRLARHPTAPPQSWTVGSDGALSAPAMSALDRERAWRTQWLANAPEELGHIADEAALEAQIGYDEEQGELDPLNAARDYSQAGARQREWEEEREREARAQNVRDRVHEAGREAAAMVARANSAPTPSLVPAGGIDALRRAHRQNSAGTQQVDSPDFRAARAELGRRMQAQPAAAAPAAAGIPVLRPATRHGDRRRGPRYMPSTAEEWMEQHPNEPLPPEYAPNVMFGGSRSRRRTKKRKSKTKRRKKYTKRRR